MRGIWPTGTWSACRLLAARTQNSVYTHHLLNLGLLEGAETASPRLHMQSTFPIVLHACLRVQTVGQRHELFVCDVLEDFCAAAIACIGIDQQKRLNLRDSRHNTADGDEFPKVYTSNIAYTKSDIRPQGFEVQVAVES